jgi:predicted membrane protein
MMEQVTMKADVHRRLANLSELILFFSGGLAVCFLVQVFPQMFVFLVLVYLAAIGYLFVDSAEDKRPFWLRVAALGFALIGGFWDVFVLFPLQVTVWLVLGCVGALVVIYIMQRWGRGHAKT